MEEDLQVLFGASIIMKLTVYNFCLVQERNKSEAVSYILAFVFVSTSL